MTDNKKDDPGKGPVWPSDKRPHATIDVQATEVGGDKPKAAAGAGSALPPPSSAQPEAARSTFGNRLAAAGELSRQAARSNGFLSHVAAGVAGAVLTLIAAALFGLFPPGGGGDEQGSSDVAKRLAALEQAMRQRTATPAGDVAAKLAATDNRVKSLEDQARTISAIGAAQAKLAADIKALDARGSPELAERLAKIEAALAQAASGDPAARGPQTVAIASKFADLEKLAGDALEAAKSGTARADQELAVVKTEAARLAQRLDALKGDVEARLRGTAKSIELAPMLTKLHAFEQDLQQFLKGEGERNSNAQRVVLTLEIANLKRAMDRGDRYAPELDAVRKVAGNTLNLAPLQRYSLEGVPTLPALTRDFRRVANATIDAEAEPADASVWERLLSGARSIVRVRKTGHTSDDMGAEAVVGRMEAALKEGRLGEVLAQGAKLPPKAALAAEDWLRKVQARYAVDQAVAEIESALKATLAARAPEPATELKR
jgi:hypothetical protein